ncbi:alpha/beta hydrolase [Erythrobacter sp. HI0063]|jgi:pimeloyl-ACP methyl ester carboxylesterase|uniref:alpha/beta fold hydrolase n=1 Tax=unclassified Erythrobacter TaxID=2633097 RepID=UPI0007C3CCA2|nr:MULTISPECIES: alpha/beta hydrolase [unclassified Erythrobacter]KZY56136.1 alpha/beta hydrolase [Erythrobacter sp. HI0063]MBO9512077.1 alpha/beta hydrolase [Erythrobacter sp. A6_0]|tara:strand:+ start:418 stop:1287 length:870 start_codon:yes stop_codon:yes gene_type:complete
MTLTGPTSQTFVSQRLRLNYLDWGNPEKPLLMLVHGGRDHARSWDWVAEELREDWHVVAFDHRGHGDSDWVSDGNYNVQDMVYDLAQLVHQLGDDEVTIVSHSMGGNVALRYAGTFPDKVRKIVAIEGLGPSPKRQEEMRADPYPQRMAEWIEKKRAAAARTPRKYDSIEAAFARMIEENSYLTEAQARHLTLHGVTRNEDGTYSWKFDPHLNVWHVEDVADEFLHQTWAAITAPTLLLYGADSWASNPQGDGRLEHFENAKVIEFENAGHWLHHDQFDRFMQTLRDFL